MGHPRVDISGGYKACPKCKTVKDLSEFGVRTGRGGTTYYSWCKGCTRSNLARYRKVRDPEKKLKQRFQTRNIDTLKNYGISYREYLEKRQAQNGRCAICDKTPIRPAKLHLDHCHTTGKIRAFICFHCNSLLGYAKDSTELLNKAAHYLEKYKA